MSANSRIRYGRQIVFVCLYITSCHYRHCANLSVDIGFMKCLPDIFCRVCEWDWAHSVSYPSFNIWGSMFSVYPISSWWLREYIALSYHHYHQIGGMNYYPLFRVRSWNNGMRCMSFYILKILRSRQDGHHHVADNIFKFLFVTKILPNLTPMSSMFVPMDHMRISHHSFT